MDRTDVKKKLKGILRDLMLEKSEKDIPKNISDFILRNYCCTEISKHKETEEFDVFLKSLQKFIEDNCQPCENSYLKNSEFAPDLFFLQKYTEAEHEYCEVTKELVTVLNEVIKYKDTYSQIFRDECKSLDVGVEFLHKKCQFLKAQLLLKLYGEEKALKGHMLLRSKLKEELSQLKKKYNDIVDYNTQISEIKNDKPYLELFKVYRELRRIEKRAEHAVAM